jgi:hypothetical protein
MNAQQVENEVVRLLQKTDLFDPSAQKIVSDMFDNQSSNSLNIQVQNNRVICEKAEDNGIVRKKESDLPEDAIFAAVSEVIQKQTSDNVLNDAEPDSILSYMVRAEGRCRARQEKAFNAIGEPYLTWHQRGRKLFD